VTRSFLKCGLIVAINSEYLTAMGSYQSEDTYKRIAVPAIGF